MELKPGYKQTEVGMVPEDWEAFSLSELGDIRSGGTPSTSKSEFWDGGIPWCTPTDITALKGRKYLHETSRTLSENGLRSSSAEIIPTRSLIMTSRATIGECAINVLPMTTNQGFKNIVPFDCLDIEYLYYVMTTQKSRLVALCGGSTFLEIGKKQLTSFQIQIPENLAEQQAIAEALSDVDALLESLDQLITKKRNLKQAAMQELLTGKTRLPGFDGEWREKRLGDHLKFLKNGVNSRAELIAEGGVKYLHYGDIHGSESLLINPSMLQMPCLPVSKASRLDRLSDGDLVFADASEDLEGIGKSVEFHGVGQNEVVSGLHTIAVRFDKNVLADGYKAYLQFMPTFRQSLKRLAAGTKVYATNRAHISIIELKLPGLKEQTAIATVLSDMDAEINALEQRRKKTRDIKQAMMQELLTGKTRLI